MTSRRRVGEVVVGVGVDGSGVGEGDGVAVEGLGVGERGSVGVGGGDVGEGDGVGVGGMGIGEGSDVCVGGWGVAVEGRTVSVGASVGVTIGNGVPVDVIAGATVSVGDGVGGAATVGGSGVSEGEGVAVGAAVVIAATAVGEAVLSPVTPPTCPQMSLPPSRMIKTAATTTTVFFRLWNVSSKEGASCTINCLAEPTLWPVRSTPLARVSASCPPLGSQVAVLGGCLPDVRKW